jgi:pimeloyl-ACP methyl ester carboxylesterase
LITQGARDAIVKPLAADQHKAGIPHAEVEIVPDAGHAPFWDDAGDFNRRLQGFATRAWSAAESLGPAV